MIVIQGRTVTIKLNLSRTAFMTQDYIWRRLAHPSPHLPLISGRHSSCWIRSVAKFWL